MTRSFFRCSGPGRRMLLLVLAAAVLAWAAPPARAIELCSGQSKTLMRQAGIGEEEIARLCRLAKTAGALLKIRLRRTENELGYCRVTLALENDSTAYLNQLTLTSVDGRFEIFRFQNVLPGTTGYAAARSRVLLACDELKRIRLGFHWPASLRIGDRSPRGARLERYKPALLSDVLYWNP